MNRRAISILRFRRSFIFQPLAAFLIVLLLPFLSRIASDTGIRISEASAQVSTNPILQNCLGRACADLRQLETDGVSAYLGLHNLPLADASIVYKYGRTDLRSGVRGAMFNILLGIILKPASQRTQHEQTLYSWLQSAVQQNEIADYTLALDQFNSWQSDPCHFALDSDIASQYDISYSGAAFCYGGGSLAGLFAGPLVPAESYFTAYGLKFSYGKPALTYPYFPSLVAETSANAAAVWKIGGGVAAAAGLAIGGVVVASVLSNVVVVAGLGQTFGAQALIALPGALGLAAGAAAIVVIGILIGVAAGLQVFNNRQTIGDLNDLNSALEQVTNTPPDLNSMTEDSLGMYKLQATFGAQTVPDVPSSATLPSHRTSDLNFAIRKSTDTTATISNTLDYEDWSGIDWSAQTYGGWFVQDCNSGSDCSQSDSITANVRFVDWSGTNWTALRFGTKFIVTKEEPAAADKECTPDPATGVSPGPNFSNCSSYLSASIPVRDPNGTLETVSLSVLAPPVFATPTTLPFTPKVSSSQTITVSGNPTPQVCYSSSIPALPSDFTMNGIALSATACAQGSFKLSFNGNPASPQQNYQLSLAASNGSSTKPLLGQFILDVSPHLGITSPATLTGTAGFPVNFLVTTTGSPTPKLSIDPGVLVSGLSFKDNDNGTATISGIAPGAVTGHRCLILNGGQCGIRAHNAQGTVFQALSIDLLAAPSASLNPPTSATFTAGAHNSVTLTTSGASTPVSWRFESGTAPAWLHFAENGNGTARLFGTPPPNTTGTFSPDLAPIAFGSGPFFMFTKYPIDVLNMPLFLSGATAAFTVGSHTLFQPSANVGTIGLVGTLPTGLSFSPAGTLDCLSVNRPSAACIRGTPAAGTAGQYTVLLTDDAGSRGSTSQSLTINVYQHSEITSSNLATFITQTPSSFAVTTSGFPNTSTQPVPPISTPPAGVHDGKGMFFTVKGLPADLQFSNLNPAGFATGTLIIQGTPSAGDAGTRAVQITAQNGLGPIARQSILLNILPLTAPAPASGSSCNGNYNGTFTGDIVVVPGQNCTFVGGTITGELQVNGGSIALFGAAVNRGVAIQGPSAFAIEGTSIAGTLFLDNIASLGSRNEICGSVLAQGMILDGNAATFQLGSFSAACSGNYFGRNVSVTNNLASMGIYNNVIEDTLSCTNSTSIIGAGNAAAQKLGQCATF
jgi:hypothetical protein